MPLFPPSNRHFAALDGWRGLCATMVALFHFNAYSHFRLLGIVQNAYLFVDFFFVLSGFVIAANYARDLRDGFGIGRFMLLRWGRLYPLHLATLLVLVAIECLAFLLGGLAGHHVLPFSSGDRSLGSLLANLLMLQGLGVERSLSWNFPSWSVSSEFAAYLLFAVAAAALPAPRLLRLLILVALASPVLLGCVSPRNMDATYDFGLIRAVGGFSAGAIAYAIYSALGLGAQAGSPARAIWTALEIAASMLIAVFVTVAGTGPLSLLGSLVFFIAVLMFSAEGGWVSRLLKSPPLLRLGVLSYSIYMVHVPVLHVLMMAVHTIERWSGTALTTPGLREGQAVMLVGRDLWQGDIVTLGVLATVILVSSLTYALIETPGRRWTRRIVDRHLPVGLRKRFETRDALPS